MSNELTWTIQTEPGATKVTLAGEITEGSNLDKLAAELSGPVVIDLHDIKRVNSAGVREWVAFTVALRNASVALTLD